MTVRDRVARHLASRFQQNGWTEETVGTAEPRASVNVRSATSPLRLRLHFPFDGIPLMKCRLHHAVKLIHGDAPQQSGRHAGAA